MKEAIGEIGKFAEGLARINKTMAELFRTGNIELFSELNREIAELYRIQHANENPVLRAVDSECAVIYRNFDMIVAVLRTVDSGEIDACTQKSLNRLLHNIDTAVVGIARAMELI